jgi:AraC-like DNA-binding protein
VTLVDLVSSINHALPRLVAASSHRSYDDELFGANIGYAYFRPAEPGAFEPSDVDDAQAWSRLRSTTVGILGAGSTGAAVARVAHATIGAEVVRCPWAPTTESGTGVRAHGEPLLRTLAADVLCVALPWPAVLTALVHCNRFAPVVARTLLVAWRRSPAFERALIHLGHRYDEPVQLGNLAAVACVSKFHLVRLFTATLGITPHRYQLMLRMARAKAMLREGTLVTQVAHGLGFADHSHLGRSFRTHMGMTPTQYQQSVGR